MIVNEYLPGQGIAAHVDNPRMFGDKVVSVSLGSAVVMQFRAADAVIDVVLPRRSAVVLTGPARYAWSHSIAARKTDMLDGRRVARGTRVSLTFRDMASSK